MNQQAIQEVVKTILISDFSVPVTEFRWDTPLVRLQESFNILGVFLNLENSLSNHFKIDIQLIEQLNSSFHTPRDIVVLIQKSLKAKED